MEGDELDVTLPQTPKESSLGSAPAQKQEHLESDINPTSGALEMSLMQKALAFLVLVFCVATYVRMRKTDPVAGEKSSV